MNDMEDVGPCKVVRLTSKAVLIRTDSDQHWIPFSMIHEDTLAHLEEGEELEEFEVARWFAEKEGIE